MSDSTATPCCCSTCKKEMTAEVYETRLELLGVTTCPNCTDLGPMPVIEDALDLRSGEVDVELPDDAE